MENAYTQPQDLRGKLERQGTSLSEPKSLNEQQLNPQIFTIVFFQQKSIEFTITRTMLKILTNGAKSSYNRHLEKILQSLSNHTAKKQGI